MAIKAGQILPVAIYALLDHGGACPPWRRCSEIAAAWQIPANVRAKIAASLKALGAVRGESNANARRLTEKDVVRIRHLLADGVPGREVARHMGVTPQMVSLIKHGRAWSHVPEGVFA